MINCFLKLLVCLFLSYLTTTVVALRTSSSVNFQKRNNNVFSFVISDLHERYKRDVSLYDPTVNCSKSDEVKKLLAQSEVKEQFLKEENFESHNSSLLQLTWVGENFESIVLLFTEGIIPKKFKLFISNPNANHTFINISSKLSDVSSDFYSLTLLKHAFDPKTFYISQKDVTKNKLFLSTDAGITFTDTPIDFDFNDEPSGILYHADDSNILMTIDINKRTLYLSKDRGLTWKGILNYVSDAKWSDNQNSKHIIYALSNSDTTDIFGGILVLIDKYKNILKKSIDYGETWTDIQKEVYSFGTEDQFLYASTYTDAKHFSQERSLKVSTDNGNVWNRARLPVITPDRFFSILDSSEGQIFLHVDQPGDTGKGTLYTSDATGIIYSESLEDHLYPNFQELTDFYKVLSMKGVYTASRLLSDNSIITYITFNRGADWKPIPKPIGSTCEDASKDCNLQIHNMYSINKGIKANMPLSVPNAVGIIMVHGHAAKSLQTTDPDIYLSSDGGYTWILSLKGPHHYQIADQGGLLVAVPSYSQYADTIKFSTNLGRCWATYKFTDIKLVFTGLLIEPGNKDNLLALWGYTEDNKIWHSFLFDFSKIIKENCTDKDYETWMAHEHNDQNGCLLGSQETFKKLKSDSWCLNGRSFQASTKTAICQCTEDDYDCDYGYKRAGEDCIKDTSAIDLEEIDVCLRGHEEKIVFEGYHKIPGDKCSGGFSPKVSSTIDLGQKCSQGTYIDTVNLEDQKKQANVVNKEKSKKSNLILFILSLFFILVICIVIIVFLSRKYKIFQRKPTYKYSSIRCEESGDNEPLCGPSATGKPINGLSSTLYDDSSDEEDKPQAFLGTLSVNGGPSANHISISSGDIQVNLPKVKLMQPNSSQLANKDSELPVDYDQKLINLDINPNATTNNVHINKNKITIDSDVELLK